MPGVRIVTAGGGGSAAVSDGSITLAKLATALQASIAKADASLSQSQVDARVQLIVSAAPAALDTLAELATALGDDADFAGTVTTLLAGKAPTSHTHPAADITSGLLDIARAPAGTVAFTTSTTVRPTARTDVMVFFSTATDPSAAMLTGDKWLRTT